MAASLIRRGCRLVNSKTSLSIFRSHLRLLSSQKEGSGSVDSPDVTDDAQKQCDKSSETSTSTQPESSTSVGSHGHVPSSSHGSRGLSSAESAVEKFFKVVEQVRKSDGSGVDALSDVSETADREKLEESSQDVSVDESLPFATMFRKSKFVSLGEFSGRLLEGTIIEVMGDDLYIDFGGKFHCVCPRPKRNSNRYHRGKKVLLTLEAMEMSSVFLGSDIHVTLLEADGTLIGLAPSGAPQRASTVRQ